MTNSYFKKFGFLKNPIHGDFSGITIRPTENHSEALKWMDTHSNPDGYYYPPQFTTFANNLTQNQENIVKQSNRPARVFDLPGSHEISISNPIDNQKELLDESLIIHLLAYIYGTRLQISTWGFEGRIPIKPTNNIYIEESTSIHFLNHVYCWWREINANCRNKFINILYMHNRALSLEWDWESFTHQYMVFDALYNLYTSLYPRKPKATTHKDRFNLLISKYKITPNDDLISKIYTTRNEIFHEAMWTGTMPCFASKDKISRQIPHHLARLNARLICKMTGYENKFSSSEWWLITTILFDKFS